MNFLVIGGNSVSGQDVIKGLKGDSPDNFVLSTTSGEGEIPGVDHTIGGIDLTDSNVADKVIAQVGDRKIDFLIYIPARGMIGMPTSYTTPEMLQESYNYSIRPMLRLMRGLKPRKTICFSGFITMEPMLQIYGCMAVTKIAMEELALRHPGKFQAIRLGMFFSKSVRGIALASQRNIKGGEYPELIPMYDEWKDSGIKKFPDFFFGKNWRFEEEVYKSYSNNAEIPFRKTEPEDIARSVLMSVNGEDAPIINVLGDWIWTDTDMIPIPEEIESKRHMMPDDLDRYFEEEKVAK